MPRKRSDTTLDDIWAISKAHPTGGFVMTGVGAAVGLVLVRIWPQSFSHLGWFIGCFFLLMSAVSLIGALAGQSEQGLRGKRFQSQTSLETLKSITWKEFEEVVADLYRRKGYRVQEVGGQSDGGIDLVLFAPDNSVIAVQCKQWRTWSVGAPKVREFVGALASMREARGGIYVTCGRYTSEAKALARNHGIELIDGETLERMIRSVNGISSPLPPRVVQPLGVLTCPVCGNAMVRRTAKRGSKVGQDFWGCSSYPRCHGTRPL